MTERALRLDFFVAVSALLISALTAVTLIYQTRVIGNQYAATIWPYLSINSTYGQNGEHIQITNDGLGPALIESARLSVDGKAVAGWNEYLQAFFTDPEVRTMVRKALAKKTMPPMTISTSSLGPSTTLRPGDTRSVLAVSYRPNLPISILMKHALGLEICYCSLNSSCWILQGTAGKEARSTPKRVARCTRSDSIAAPSNVFRVRRS